MIADHSAFTMVQKGTWWHEATRLRAKLAVGDLRPVEVTWLYATTGYAPYTVSALRMCDEIIAAYTVEGVTARLMR